MDKIIFGDINHIPEAQRMAEDWAEDFEYDRTTRPASEDDFIPKPVNSLTLCGLLVDVLVKQGWLIKQKRENQTLYFLTRKGYEKLEAMGVQVKRLF